VAQANGEVIGELVPKVRHHVLSGRDSTRHKVVVQMRDLITRRVSIAGEEIRAEAAGSRFEGDPMDRSRTWVVESRHDLRLVSAGHKPRRVARIIAGFTDRTRREAMGMIETAPVLILQGANYATAEDARIALERLGATVEERAYEVETAGRPAVLYATPPTSRQTVWTIVGWGFLILFLICIILVVVASLIVASAGGGDPTF
jgi:ribosomal protein L7/L12